MWPFKDKEAKQKPTNVAAPEKVVPTLPVAMFNPDPGEKIDPMLLAEYAQLAKELEYFPHKVVEQLFLHTLKKLGLKIFAVNQVRNYLTAKHERDGQTGFWSWWTLHKPELQYICDEYSYLYTRFSKTGQFMYGKSYDLPLPMAVLKIVSALHQEVPGLKFFVSHSETHEMVDTHSFLMVDTGSFTYIICSWETPGSALEQIF